MNFNNVNSRWAQQTCDYKPRQRVDILSRVSHVQLFGFLYCGPEQNHQKSLSSTWTLFKNSLSSSSIATPISTTYFKQLFRISFESSHPTIDHFVHSRESLPGKNSDNWYVILGELKGVSFHWVPIYRLEMKCEFLQFDHLDLECLPTQGYRSCRSLKNEFFGVPFPTRRESIFVYVTF